MDDLISRQAAIDSVEKESQVDGAYGYMDTKSIVDLLNDLPSAQPGRYMVTTAESTDLDILKEIINKPSDITIIPLPSAEPQRKKGKWIWLSSTYDRTPCEMRYMCSECHHETIVHSNEMASPWEKFCPNCGAEMRGDEQGTNDES